MNPNYRAMMRLSMNLEVMPQSYRGHNFILGVINEVTIFMVIIPIYQSQSEEIGDALIGHVFSNYSIKECMNMDQEITFMSTLLNYLFKKLSIKIQTVAP